MPEIARVLESRRQRPKDGTNVRVYGVRKVWWQLRREGHDLARCTVARPMHSLGLEGVIRGKPVRTTISDKAAPCPLDHVNRQFKAPHPNVLWVSDFTYVVTWSGFPRVALISDAARGASWDGACRGRRMGPSCWMRSDRSGTSGASCIAAVVCIAATGAPARLHPLHRAPRSGGIEPSVGSVGDSYDNALAESINGSCKAEVVRRRGPWRSLEAMEFPTLEWGDWFSHRRLPEPIGNIPPAEAEALCCAAQESLLLAA